MDRQYDLVTVGTGVTATVATRCREAGWSVAVVDRQPFGGTCALRGCVPKKILVAAADAVQGARDNLLEGNRRPSNYEGIASAVFTIPPLASVGLLEDTARTTRRRFRVNHQDTVGWFNARRVGETAPGFKVLIDEETDHILGARLLGPRADEVINLFAVAVRLRIPARELQQVLFAYPTSGSDGCFML